MSRSFSFGSRVLRRVSVPVSNRAHKAARRRRLFFERLEDRRVLDCKTGSTDWLITTTPTTVTVELTDFDDILVGTTHVAGPFDTRFGLKDSLLGPICWFSSFPASELTKITVRAKDGDDQIDLRGMDAASFGGLANSNPAADVKGDDGEDQIWGLWARNLLKGDNHNDTIYGNNYPDDLHGGDHDDTIHGGWGDDQIKGNGGGDHIYGGRGLDTIMGDAGEDFLYGEEDNDTIYGGDHSDYISGGSGDDTLYGDHGGSPPQSPVPGMDVIEGNDGNDLIDGGPLSDVLYSNAPGLPVDQPWRFDNQGNPFWNNMDSSGPDNDGECDLEDEHPDKDGTSPCPGPVIATEDDYVVSHSASLSVDSPGVLANDTYDTQWGLESMTVIVLNGPQHGTLNIAPDKSFTYDPDDNYATCNDGGTYTYCYDSFYYYLKQTIVTTDTYSNLTVAKIKITNQKPTAGDDELSTVKNTPTEEVDIVTPNDSDGDANDAIQIEAITDDPDHGTVQIIEGKKVKYTPAQDFVGEDVFWYTVTDGLTTSAPAKVTVQVSDSGGCGTGAPEAVDDWHSAVPDAFGNVLDNDSDPSGIPSSAVVTLVSGPSHAIAFNLEEDGDFTYTMEDTYSGNDYFTYQFTACGQTSNIATVTLESMALRLNLPPVRPTSDASGITNTDVALLASEAARRWVEAGMDPIAARRILDETEFVVADLPGSILGRAGSRVIYIDVNAAGYGWFVDATSSTDEEFSIYVSDSERQAGRGSAALGKADLLTVLMHELGHILGLPHLEGEEFEHSVMNDTLGLSMRRVPTAADILAADEYYASLGYGGSLVKRRQN